MIDAGARVIGVCAHIASVIWYLAFGRYLPRLHLPAVNLDDNISDASVSFYDTDNVGEEDMSD